MCAVELSFIDIIEERTFMGQQQIQATEGQDRLKSLAEFRFQMRKFLSFSEMASERCGIGAQQYQLMQVIAAIPEGQVATITYLADRMILRHNSTVELVDRAERSGLVRRETDERDLRRSVIVLTEQGRSLLDKLVAEHLSDLAPRADSLIEALRNLQMTTEMGR